LGNGKGSFNRDGALAGTGREGGVDRKMRTEKSARGDFRFCRKKKGVKDVTGRYEVKTAGSAVRWREGAMGAIGGGATLGTVNALAARNYVPGGETGRFYG